MLGAGIGLLKDFVGFRTGLKHRVSQVWTVLSPAPFGSHAANQDWSWGCVGGAPLHLHLSYQPIRAQLLGNKLNCFY